MPTEVLINLDELLGNAYRLDQAAMQRPRAVALIKEAAASNPAIRAALVHRRDMLRQVRDARQVLDRHGCHVTATQFDLLDAALR